MVLGGFTCRIDMDGWQTIASKCTPEVIVWVLHEGDSVTTVNWLLEEDADDNTLEGLDSRNIIQGKRRRVKVDYAALEKQIDEEQRQYEDVFSDASSSSEGRKAPRSPENGRVDSTEMSPKEWSEYQGKQAKKAVIASRGWPRSQWALPDFKHELQIAVGTAGLHPRAPDPSGQRRT
eukprot:s1811_g16.t1